MSSFIRLILAFCLGVSVGVGCTLKQHQPAKASEDVTTATSQIVPPKDAKTEKPKEDEDTDAGAQPAPATKPPVTAPQGPKTEAPPAPPADQVIQVTQDVRHVTLPIDAKAPAFQPDPAQVQDPRDAEDARLRAEADRREEDPREKQDRADQAAATAARSASSGGGGGSAPMNYPAPSSQELTYIEGLTVEGSEPPVRLYTHEEAVAKADELINAGVEYARFMGLHAFLLSVEDHPLRDKAAVDKAIELSRSGFDQGGIRATYDFLNELVDPSSNQKLQPPAQSLDMAINLVKNSYFDLETLRTTFAEISHDGSVNMQALHQSFMQLGLNPNGA